MRATHNVVKPDAFKRRNLRRALGTGKQNEHHTWHRHWQRAKHTIHGFHRRPHKELLRDRNTARLASSPGKIERRQRHVRVIDNFFGIGFVLLLEAPATVPLPDARYKTLRHQHGHSPSRRSTTNRYISK